jgi:uncharacterized protein
MENRTLEINVAQLLKEEQGASREYRIEDTVKDDNGIYPVTGEVRLISEDHRVLVQGRIKTGINLQCSRCLKSYKSPICMDVVEEFYPTIDIQTGFKLPAPEEPGVFTIDEHHILDLTEALRQYIVIATPMKPLCSPDCAGICPHCGKDLNKGLCNCPDEHVDPRWAELLKLKKKTQVQDKGRSK